MIDRTQNFAGRPAARQTGRGARPVPEVEPPHRAGDRPGGGGAGPRRARPRPRHGEINPSGAPLSSATFITQYIAQEHMPAHTVDPRAGARSYDRRALSPIKKSDLIRRA